MIVLPGWHEWAFATKTFAAAVAALYLAMWFDLPRPYWALTTVYITSQVLAAATLSKAIYRVLGTFLGAAVSIILVPNLVNAPILLSIAIALWVGFCLYVSLLDRTPRSYVMMLAGYTLAIIGFPAVDTPGEIFDMAVSRVEEITLGIVCASVVSIVVLPESTLPQITSRLNAWVRNARAWIIDIFDHGGRAGDTQLQRLRLASDAIALDGLAASLQYDTSGRENAPAALATLRQHMLMFLPMASAMADRIRVLGDAGRLDEKIRMLLAHVAWWLRSDLVDEILANELRERARLLAPALGPESNWSDLIRASLLQRLRDLIDLRQDTRQLKNFLRDGGSLRRPLKFTYTARAKSIRHRDHGIALLSGVGAAIATLIACFVWIETSWPDGSAAPMMAAVGCSFFATFDDPAPHILKFANAAIVGALCAGTYLFAILPHATNFEMLVLALAPWLVTCGVFMAQPQTATFATGVTAVGGSMIAIQNGAIGDFTPFANSAIAIIAGMWIAAVVVRLVRSVGAEWSARRLRRINRESLAHSAIHEGSNHGLELAALMLDRLGLIAPRLAALPPEDAEWTDDLLAEVRSAINIVALRRVRTELSPHCQAAIETTLANAALYFTSNAEDSGMQLLQSIDQAMRELLNQEQTDAVTEALLGLVGLRRGLFPEAGPFAADRTTAGTGEREP